MKSRYVNLAINTYERAGILLSPLAHPYLKIRAASGKEDWQRYREKLGLTEHGRPDGDLAWIHAASVGEVNAIIPVAQRLHQLGLHLVISTVTLTGARVVKDRLAAIAIHQFAPLDLKPAINRFLTHWRPKLVMFSESEVWPTTLNLITSNDIPIILINGRISKTALTNWTNHLAIAKEIFGKFSCCCMSSIMNGEHIAKLGGKNIHITGNLKFDVDPGMVDDRLILTIQRTNRPIWLAASTHQGEEIIIAKAHKLIQNSIPEILTIITPRHPQRGTEIARTLAKLGLKTSLCDNNDQISQKTEIYIRNTIGDLATLYRVAPAAFVGGSLIKHGGHNPIEPAQILTPIIHGPHVDNFSEIYESLRQAGGALKVNDETQLAQAVISLITDKAKAKNLTTNAKACIDGFKGAIDNTMKLITPYL